MSSFTTGLRALTLGLVVVGLAACSATSAAPSQTPAPAPSVTPAPSATPAPSGSQLHIVGVEYAFEGRWVLAWKHRIDRAFVREYQLPP